MKRILPKSFVNRWENTNDLIQVIVGPRQVGKTTAITTISQNTNSVYATADQPMPPTVNLIIENWEKARLINKKTRAVLILDEIQKIPRWSETVKMLWDEDVRNKTIMDVWILGSSAMLIEKGLSESLTGRFESNFFPHWVYEECRKAFSATLEDYLFIGGYPKAYTFKEDKERCEDYIQNGILETTLGRDVLTMHAVDKPALLKQLFWYTSKLPARIVSYEKILSHLQGKGNSATLVHYANLLSMSFILIPLSKYSGAIHRTKRSIPKWIIPNPALVDPSEKQIGLNGFTLENLVGSHILNLIFGKNKYSLCYWREDNKEVDFILTEYGKAVLAIEVKSGRAKNVPNKKYLEDHKINCHLVTINKDNIESFMKTTSAEQLLKEF